MPDGFGRLAQVYETLERAVYGDLLQRARLALVDELTGAKRILILGEGDGRFVLALLQRHKTCSVTVLEHSPGMVTRARARLEACLPEARARVTFQQEDALKAGFSAHEYDAVVTNFFLDLFSEVQLRPLLESLDACLEPGGLWLLSDFAPPSAVHDGRQRLLSRLLLPLMYTFFRLTTGLPATRLVSPQPFLQACGLRLERAERFRGGFVYAELWQKPEACYVPNTRTRTGRDSPAPLPPHGHHGGG